MNLPWKHWFDKHGQIERCKLCNAPLCWDLLTDLRHDEDLCLGRQLQQTRAENKKLKTSLEEWKDAWFQLREIIGKLSWSHLNCPHDRKPAQPQKPNVWLHPNEQYVQEGNLVWEKVPADWKMVGAGTSEEAGKAIIRLMSVKINQK